MLESPKEHVDRLKKIFGDQNYYGKFSNKNHTIFLSSDGQIKIKSINDESGSFQTLPGVNFYTLDPNDKANKMTEEFGSDIWSEEDRNGVTFKEYLTEAQERAGVSFD